MYCRRLGFDPDEHGLAVISVGGVGSLAKWCRLFTTYGIPTYVIFDNGTADDANGARRNDLLATIGVPEEEREELMGTSELRVTATWAVMGVDFETCLRGYFGDAYDVLDQEAKSASPGAAGKPLRARTIAEQLPLTEGTEGRDCLAELVQRLRTHTLQDE